MSVLTHSLHWSAHLCSCRPGSYNSACISIFTARC